MNFNFPLLKKCAFAVTLLSLSHIQGYADQNEESSAYNKVEMSQESNQDLLAADSLFNALDNQDITFENAELDNNLLAKANKKKRKKNNKNRHSALPDDMADLAAQSGNNTWIPRFVWMGDVENSDNLKCFAAFLIGSLSDQSNMGVGQPGQSFSPGVIMTPQQDQNQSQLSTSLNEDYIAQRTQNSKNKNRHRDSRQRPNNKKGCPKARVYLDLHAGPSFLFFTGYEGNLMPKPARLFPPQTGPGTNLRVKGQVRYNVTPLMEMNATLNLFKWLGISAYLQSNPGYSISTQPYNKSSNRTAGPDMRAGNIIGRFQSDLDLNAVGGKLQFNFPNLVRFKTWSMGLFLAGGCGASFQTWKNSIGYQSFEDSVDDFGYLDQDMVFNTEYITNFSYTGDAAISFKSRRPYPMTLVKFGCKFIGWGQAGNLGTPRSPDYSYGYIHPLSIEGIFAIVPYLGFTWAF